MKQGSLLHERDETNPCPTRNFEKKGEKKIFYLEEEYNSGDIFFITINKKHILIMMNIMFSFNFTHVSQGQYLLPLPLPLLGGKGVPLAKSPKVLPLPLPP